jgi:Pectobacterium phage endonuclease
MMWFDNPATAERFYSKVKRSADCFVWTGGTAGAGYGVFRLSRPRRQEYAHRLALERKLARPLERGEMVRHTCDNPPCVNPDHLLVGDQTQNMADSITRGRFARGEDKPLTARLTAQDVREIRALIKVPGVTQSELARRYGVTRTSISHIKSGRTWAHLPG